MPVSRPQTYCADHPLRDMFVTGEPSRDDELPIGAEGFHADPAAKSIGVRCYWRVKALDPTPLDRGPGRDHDQH